MKGYCSIYIGTASSLRYVVGGQKKIKMIIPQSFRTVPIDRRQLFYLFEEDEFTTSIAPAIPMLRPAMGVCATVGSTVGSRYTARGGALEQTTQATWEGKRQRQALADVRACI